MFEESMMQRHGQLLSGILGIHSATPMDAQEMARQLQVTFYPQHNDSHILRTFADALKRAFEKVGVHVIPYSKALEPSKPGKVRPGIVIVEQGEGKTEDMAIHHVSSLHQNPLVALYDTPPPVRQEDSNQALLDAIVGVLAWNLTHIPVFIEKNKWTFCTMNGAVINCSMKETFVHDVLYSLIPKLAAQVIPPKREELLIRKYTSNAVSDGYAGYIEDLSGSSMIWKNNGLMLGHTAVDQLVYRGRRYKRIVKAYLDGRSGMSYGFLVRQLPINILPARKRSEHHALFERIHWDQGGLGKLNGRTYAQVQILNEDWIVSIPEVWVMGTRSGCDKTNINRERDIIFTGLSNQKIMLKIPEGVKDRDVRPSYDTSAILAHAVGNAVTASVLMAIDKDNPFSAALSRTGLTISHWHGYLPDNKRPLGYLSHGSNNLPVSCSTPQSAIYAFCGKMLSLEKAIDENIDYRGDIHVEPHHGTNMVGIMSLQATAAWIDKTYLEKRQLQILTRKIPPRPKLSAVSPVQALAS